MDAPAANPPVTDLLPWGMTPYRPGDFEKMHAPGTMLASASGIPALFNLFPQRFGPLAYAMHLKGERPLPDPGNEPHVRVGSVLEELVAELLSEELEAKVSKLDGFAKHAWLPMYSTPDGEATTDVQRQVEIKVVTPRVYWEHWRDGPPLHVNIQHQVQFATTGAEAGIIAVFNLGYCNLEWFPTEPHKPTIEKIELKVGDFMDDLENGIYPDPEDCEPDFEAFRELMWQSDPEKTIAIDGGEAELRAQQFLQAKLDYAAAEKTIEANKRWFQRHMRDAQMATIGTGIQAEWKTNKAKVRVFKLKEIKGDRDG